jgi:hypothetical protein
MKMHLDLSDEPAEQEVLRLRRELVHVQEQSRIAHGLAMTWKQRAVAAEEQVRRLQGKLDRREVKQSATATVTSVNQVREGQTS